MDEIETIKPRRDQLARLFAIQESCWRGGNRLTIEDLLKSNGVTSILDDDLLSLISFEYRLRVERGESVDPMEYEKRFSHLAGRLGSIEKAPQASIDTAVFGDSRISHRTIAIPVREDKQFFGEYELLGEISRGGMGVVYRARQLKLNRIVALKMILSGQFASDDEVRRFYSEAEAVAKLDHVGIIPIYEVGCVGDQHFFSMAYVDGGNLAQLLAKGPMPERRAAELLRSIAEAIQYAHEHQIIHRDLKPQNILLTQSGQPKVTDFGLAKLASAEQNLTISGQILGTPGYMPPEQARGDIKNIGPKSDVYALGAVLFSMLTGKPPFQASSHMSTLKLVLETEPLSPRKINPNVSKDLETICLRCLSKDIHARIPTALELSRELSRFLNGEPIQSRPLATHQRIWRWCKRNPVGTALMSAMAVILTLSTIVIWATNNTRRVTETNRRIQETDEIVRGLDRHLTTIKMTSKSQSFLVRRRNGFIL